MPETVKSQIETILQGELAPQLLEVRDDSHKHAGHAGARPEGETHFHVLVVAGEFAGQSRVARQRRVFALLDGLLQTRIHALQLQCLTPEEHAARS